MVLVLLMFNSVLPVPESRKTASTDVGIIASESESYTKTLSWWYLLNKHCVYLTRYSCNGTRFSCEGWQGKQDAEASMNHLRIWNDLWHLHQNTASGKCVNITVKYLNHKCMIETCFTITVWCLPRGRCLARSVRLFLGHEVWYKFTVVSEELTASILKVQDVCVSVDTFSDSLQNSSELTDFTEDWCEN